MLLFITFCIVFVIQIFFYLFLFGNFSFSKPQKRNYQQLPVSVIVCAKNEATNLKQFLPYIANQDYNNFEIVLVNDASTDSTLKVLTAFKSAFQSDNISIQIITNTENIPGKKSALSLGINAASNPYLIVTDADCKPETNHWISEISSCFTEKKKIVLAYSPYQKIDYSFLNKIIRFETLLTAIQYFSYAKIGKAYMGVGRNMGYTKEIFEQSNGFEKHKHIQSGDDDLFINEVSNKKNTSICISKNSFTISKPETNLKKWIHQKSRHITTATHYKKTHKIALGLFFISQFSFWIFTFLLLILQINTSTTIILLFIRLSIWYFVIYKSAKLLHEKDLVILAPLFELTLIFIQLYIFIKNKIIPPKAW